MIGSFEKTGRPGENRTTGRRVSLNGLPQLRRGALVTPAPAVQRALHEAGKPYVHAFYHDQLLMMTYSYLGQDYGRRLVVLSSRHRDGEYVSRTLERFGHQMVRGSTGRGGVAGLKEMIRHLRSDRDVAFATDGPRGPRHRVQMGAIEAARIGRAPLVPVALGLSKKKTFDRGTPSRSLCLSGGPSSSMASRLRCLSRPTVRRWR